MWPGPVGRNIAEQMRDHALRKIIRLDLVGDRELLEFWRQAPMAADHAADQAFMREMVQTTVLAVTLARGIDQRQIVRLALGVGRIALVG